MIASPAGQGVLTAPKVSARFLQVQDEPSPSPTSEPSSEPTSPPPSTPSTEPPSQSPSETPTEPPAPTVTVTEPPWCGDTLDSACFVSVDPDSWPPPVDPPDSPSLVVDLAPVVIGLALVLLLLAAILFSQLRRP
jgi:hypothetical protein